MAKRAQQKSIADIPARLAPLEPGYKLLNKREVTLMLKALYDAVQWQTSLRDVYGGGDGGEWGKQRRKHQRLIVKYSAMHGALRYWRDMTYGNGKV